MISLSNHARIPSPLSRHSTALRRAQMTLSRRWFLRAVGPAAATVVSSPAVAAADDQPLTSAEYLSEMRAIGWRPVAMCFGGKPVHVIEYGPKDARSIGGMLPFWAIQKRVGSSGSDFWKRTSAYLFEQGLH